MGSNYYLGYMSGLYTRELDWNSAAIYPARDYTRLWEIDNYMSSQPYGFHYSYPGGGSYNYVADSFSLPYEVAMRAHGYGGDPTALGMARVQEQCALAAQNTGKNLMASQASDALQGAQSIGEWKDSEALAERADLKESARKIEEKARALLKRLEDVMKNKDKLPEPEVLAKVKAIKELAIPLKEEAEEIFEQCKEAEKTYNDKKAEDARREAEEAAENAGSGGDGSSSVETEEGDKELTTNAQLASEYNVKAPVIDADADVSSAVRDLKDHTSNDDDADDYTAVKEMFTGGRLKDDNIIEVLDNLLNSQNHDVYDGIYEMDNSKEIMNKFLDALKARVTLLQNNSYLTSEEAQAIRKIITDMESKLGSGEDIPSGSPKITIDGAEKDFNEAFKCIIEKCKITVNGEKVLRGSQKHFDQKVSEKQEERKKKALKDFWTAHAKTKPGKTLKSEEAQLPEGVTYLPNSKQFQYKYDAEHIYKADSYTALNDKILNSRDRDVIAAWNEIVKKLDENLNS